MHNIIRQSLLASIQTIRAVLLGMETLLRTTDTHEQKSAKSILAIEEDDISPEDQQALAKILGIEEPTE